MNVLPVSMRLVSLSFLALLLATSLHAAPPIPDSNREIPGPLKLWNEWATWNDRDLNSPSTYQGRKKTPPILAIPACAAG